MLIAHNITTAGLPATEFVGVTGIAGLVGGERIEQYFKAPAPKA